MAPVILLVLLLNLSQTFGGGFQNNRVSRIPRDIGVQPQREEPGKKPKDSSEINPNPQYIQEMKLSPSDEEANHVQYAHPVVSNISAASETAVQKSSSKGNITAPAPNVNNSTKKSKPTEMESGALVRGVLVFVAISVLLMIYMAVKTYRRRGSRPIMVQKYGVRTRRSDLEMTPLPLDEDEEDETLFDVGNVSR